MDESPDYLLVQTIRHGALCSVRVFPSYETTRALMPTSARAGSDIFFNAPFVKRYLARKYTSGCKEK